MHFIKINELCGIYWFILEHDVLAYNAKKLSQIHEENFFKLNWYPRGERISRYIPSWN